MSRTSPRIQHVAWGEIQVEGLPPGRDMKLWPGGGREWDWTETGTHHDPGIQVADVRELLDQGSEVVVLSRGMNLRLGTCPRTLEYLRRRRVRWISGETREAVQQYNELVLQGERVGGLFHSTC